MPKSKRITAGVLLIGDELLSGRTRDVNLQEIATFLAPLGIGVAEVRIVPDEQDRIVMALNALRTSNKYVFTTGGIGPTHDDITADAVAAAFDAAIDVRAEALAIVEDWYKRSGTPLTESRKRMARIPAGASLIANPVTGAPGFQIGNVFVMAGVPKIMRGMLEDVAHRLEGGAVTHSTTVSAGGLREGDLAEALRALQDENHDVSIGSYPFFIEVRDGAPKRGTKLVARGIDRHALKIVGEALFQIVRDAGGEPSFESGESH